ncbi:N-acetylmuramoyl-L-alanine amidase [Flavobacterium sp. W1B]|uniref:N-acetylmuramoyl-L-alanine amidase n=1 Tax=Flavobacterium sp. W1B TaxID=3394146 RepID=UPI0039BD1BDF
MKKNTLFFLVLAVIVSFAFTKPKVKALKQINVVIDAGHGRSELGTNAGGNAEKKIIKQLITKIQSFNKNKNIVIHFIRSSDKFVPLEDITTFINTIKPDLVLSLHVNSSTDTNTCGMGFYVSIESKSYETSNLIAEKFQTKFINANFKVSEIKYADFQILKKSEVPAIMMELGYLTNENDKKILVNNIEQKQIAKKIIECISELE